MNIVCQNRAVIIRTQLFHFTISFHSYFPLFNNILHCFDQTIVLLKTNAIIMGTQLFTFSFELQIRFFLSLHFSSWLSTDTIVGKKCDDLQDTALYFKLFLLIWTILISIIATIVLIKQIEKTLIISRPLLFTVLLV